MTLFIRDMYIEKWVSYKAMEIGKECGEGCDHWYDYDKAKEIQDSVKATDYKISCFMPTVILYPQDGEIVVEIRCYSCNPARRVYEEYEPLPHLICNKKFPELEKRLAAEFNKFLGKKK